MVALDDPIVRKTGKNIHGSGWKRDPLGYRLRQGSRLLYRQPAYLLCTDPDLSLEEFLQSCLWRWDIEVNFREEKTLIGTGDAHVRTAASNQHLPRNPHQTYQPLFSPSHNREPPSHTTHPPNIIRRGQTPEPATQCRALMSRPAGTKSGIWRMPRVGRF